MPGLVLVSLRVRGGDVMIVRIVGERLLCPVCEFFLVECPTDDELGGVFDWDMMVEHVRVAHRAEYRKVVAG